jgi:hypothetical protein
MINDVAVVGEITYFVMAAYDIPRNSQLLQNCRSLLNVYTFANS